MLQRLTRVGLEARPGFAVQLELSAQNDEEKTAFPVAL